MIGFKLFAHGLEEAVKYLQNQQARAQAFQRVRVFVGSNLKYAYGIEFGQHRGGRLARRAGGAFMLTNAINAIRPEVDDIFRAVGTSGFDFGTALWRLGMRVQTIAMSKTPVVTGSLRRSMHTVREG